MTAESERKDYDWTKDKCAMASATALAVSSRSHALFDALAASAVYKRMQPSDFESAVVAGAVSSDSSLLKKMLDSKSNWGGALDRITGAEEPKSQMRYSVLSLAIRSKNIGALEAMLDAGADPDHAEPNTARPLATAALHSLEALRMLLARGASHSKPSPAFRGFVPMMAASQSEFCKEAIDELVHAGASVEARDSWGRTALHYAVAKRIEAVERLLDLGADPSALDQDGRTPAMLAIEISKEKAGRETRDPLPVLRALIARGARLDRSNFDGENALGLALRCSTEQVALYAMEHGASPDSMILEDGKKVSVVRWCTKNAKRLVPIMQAAILKAELEQATPEFGARAKGPRL